MVTENQAPRHGLHNPTSVVGSNKEPDLTLCAFKANEFLNRVVTDFAPAWCVRPAGVTIVAGASYPINLKRDPNDV